MRRVKKILKKYLNGNFLTLEYCYLVTYEICFINFT